MWKTLPTSTQKHHKMVYYILRDPSCINVKFDITHINLQTSVAKKMLWSKVYAAEKAPSICWMSLWMNAAKERKINSSSVRWVTADITSRSRSLKRCMKLYAASIPSLGCVITLIQADCEQEEQKWETEMKPMSFRWKVTHRGHTAPPDPSPSGQGASWTEAASRPRRNRRATRCSTRTRTRRRPHPGQSTAGRIRRRSRRVSSWRDLQAKSKKRTQGEEWIVSAFSHCPVSTDLGYLWLKSKCF